MRIEFWGVRRAVALPLFPLLEALCQKPQLLTMSVYTPIFQGFFAAPFANGLDIDHVRHAFDQLAPGGRVVAVMSEGPFFRQDRKASEFREWLDALAGESEQLPEDSFRGVEAFRETGVRTRLVSIEKE